MPGLTLLAGICAAARWGFMPDAIDGTRMSSSHSLEINLRYNRNTLERVVLAAIAWTGLAVTHPHVQLVLVPAAALLFGFAHIAFWIGYLIHPTGCTIGMVLTALRTLAACAWLACRALAGS